MFWPFGHAANTPNAKAASRTAVSRTANDRYVAPRGYDGTRSSTTDIGAFAARPTPTVAREMARGRLDPTLLRWCARQRRRAVEAGEQPFVEQPGNLFDEPIEVGVGMLVDVIADKLNSCAAHRRVIFLRRTGVARSALDCFAHKGNRLRGAATSYCEPGELNVSVPDGRNVPRPS